MNTNTHQFPPSCHFTCPEDLLPHLFSYKDSNEIVSLDKVRLSLAQMGVGDSGLYQAIENLETKNFITFNPSSQEIKILPKATQERQKINLMIFNELTEKINLLREASNTPNTPNNEEEILETKSTQEGITQKTQENEDIIENSKNFINTTDEILQRLGKKDGPHSKKKTVRIIERVTQRSGKSTGAYITTLIKNGKLRRTPKGNYYKVRDNDYAPQKLKPKNKVVKSQNKQKHLVTLKINLSPLPTNLHELKGYSEELTIQVATLEEVLNKTKENLERSNKIRDLWKN